MAPGFDVDDLHSVILTASTSPLPKSRGRNFQSKTVPQCAPFFDLLTRMAVLRSE
jgi:hypothetical protein